LKKGLFSLFVALSLALAAGAAALATAMAAAPTVVTPNAVQWKPVAGISGAQSAVLFGDPTKAGSEYAIRYKLADGVKFPPHTHPKLEQVTVLSGTFLVAVGSKWDASKLNALPAGTFVAIPAGLPHYGMSKGATVLEVHGVGPDVFNFVKKGM
jgi:quercetin dioxygenase-like cupin family protein